MTSGIGTVRAPSTAPCVRAITLAVMLALVVGCRGDSTSPATSGPVTGIIGPLGGTLTGPDGVQVVIPAGALNQPTSIGIARSSAGAPVPLPGDNPPADGVYEFTPHDLIFNKPVTIRMPVPPAGVGPEVFMASLGADWQVNDATVVDGFAEWERNSFSWGMMGGCLIPSGSTDPYPCLYPRGWALAEAASGAVITRLTSAYPGDVAGSAGSWVVNQPGTVSVTLHYEAAPDCGTSGAEAARAKLIRWNGALPVGAPDRVVKTLFDGPVGLTLTTFSVFGGGSYQRLTGSTTVDVSAELSDVTNVFGFTFSCQRPGRSRHSGGDLITIIGPMAAPSTASYTIGGTVTGLTGTVVLRNNGGDNQTVTAPNGAFTFAPIPAGASYNVSVLTQPAGQSCTVTNGSGTATANVSNVAVACISIGGATMALVPDSLILRTYHGVPAFLAGVNLIETTGQGEAALGALTCTIRFVGFPGWASVAQCGDSIVVRVAGGFGTSPDVIFGDEAFVQVSAANAPGTVELRIRLAVFPLAIGFVPDTFFATAVSGPGTARMGVDVRELNGQPESVLGPLQCTVNSPLEGPPFVLDQCGDSVIVTASTLRPSGDWIFSVDVQAPNAPAGPIGATVRGTLRTTPASTGGLALVANSGGNTLSIYRVDAATGALASLGTVATGVFPYRIAVSPNGLYAYVSNLAGNSLSSYSINSTTGSLSLIPLSSPGTTNPFGIAMDPLGRFVWVVNYSAHTVSGFAIAPTTGVLTAAGAPVATGLFPYALAVHPTGNYVYVVNEVGHSVSVFSVNAGTGALTLLGGTIANSVAAPHGIAIDPTGQFAYVADAGANKVAAFRINAGTGTLTVIGAVNSNGVEAVTVHPNGQFVYAGNRSNPGTISVFSINPATGALTEVGSPVGTGGSAAGPLVINSAGTVLYATNQGSNSVSIFSIDAVTGTLTAVGAPVAAGSGPEGIALTP